MAFLPAILALLTALPDILKLIEQVGPEFGNLIKNLYTWIKHMSGNDPQGYIKTVGNAFAELDLAKTEEERQKAAKAIADAIQGLS